MIRILLFILSICFFSCENVNPTIVGSRVKHLPYYDEATFTPHWFESNSDSLNSFHKIPSYKLVNQDGDTISEATFDDHIYVTDFFFTSCGTICPIMTDNMAKIQEEFIDNDDIMFLSLSVTPEIDSVSVLKEYAISKGVIDTKWNITTGNKKHIYNLARQSYFAVVEQGDGGLQDFIHTPNFILVDKEKQIRGIYDGTNDEDVKRLIDDIRVLEN